MLYSMLSKTWWLAASALLLVARAGFAQDAASFYRRNCAACHSIGAGKLVGPDLKLVENRKDRKWLVDFLIDPKTTFDQGDPYGKQLLANAGGMVMPKVPGVDRAMAEALLDYIASASKGGTGAAGANALKSFTAADIALGRALAQGSKTLANSGPPCESCHRFAGAGGKLGPDLTREFDRLGGRKGVSTWLSAPPTPTMRAIYGGHSIKPAEIDALAAFLESQPKETADGTGRWFLGLMGLGGCAIALVLMNAAWGWRFRAVREPLTKKKAAQ